jgi:hypothetical protein
MEKIEDVIYLIDSEEKEKTKNLLFSYLERWPWFMATCILGVALGYFIFRNTPTSYQTSSRILVGNVSNDMNSVLAFNPDITFVYFISKHIKKPGLGLFLVS